MVATAQRFSELHPGTEILWTRRPLQAFADTPLSRLAEEYDLLVIDHPFVGAAAASDFLLPLDEHVPSDFLSDQARHSVGGSHESYRYAGRQWALAIDAAAPISGRRPDSIESPPPDWAGVLELARGGRVAVAALPVDCLMNFFMLCCTLGEEPCRSADRVVAVDAGADALELLRELLCACPSECFVWNPIAVWEALASGGRLAYCPFAYGYSNYARRGYAAHALRFGGLPLLRGNRLRSTLGGAGLAISRKCMERETALAYALYVAGAECQAGLYGASGGQPAHRAAWLDPETNRISNNFFRDTLSTLDDAWVRPRYPGYIEFQTEAGELVQEYLKSGGDARQTLGGIEQAYARSRTGIRGDE